MKAYIPQKALKAVSRFSAIKDVRYYLNGVYIEASPVETRATATDGHTMGIYRHLPDTDCPNDGFCSVIVPGEAVQAAARWKFPKFTPDITIEQDGDKWSLFASGQGVTFTPIDAKFPDYRKVIPQAVSGEAGHFNPDYISRCQDAAIDLHGKKTTRRATILHNGTGCARVDCGDENFVAVVMPIRAPDGFDAKAPPPAWIKEAVAVAEEALKIAA